MSKPSLAHGAAGVSNCPAGHPHHKAWGKEPQQPTTKQTRQAAKQTNSQTQPTHQQTKKTTVRQNTIKIRQKIDQTSTKNLPKSVQNWSFGSSWGGLEAILGGPGRILAPRANNSPKSWFVGPPWPPKLDPKSTKN